jgi:flagellar motor component MotA
MHGALAIQQGQNPRIFVDRLSVFLHGGGKHPKGQREAAESPKGPQKIAA